MWIDPELQMLADGGRFDEMEALWMSRLETAPNEATFFAAALQAFVRAGHEKRAGTLAQLLLEAQREAADSAAELAFLKEGLSVWPQSALLRAELFDALRRVYADRPNLEKLLQHFKLAEAADPQSALAAMETWLQFDVGRAVQMPGRSLGRIAEINLALGSIRVDFPGNPRLTLKLAEAQRLLTPLPAGHFLLEKLERPEALQALAESDPSALLAMVFASLQKPLAVSELKSALSGVVPEERWSGWWKRAGADTRLASSGGKRPTYTWSASGEAAENALRTTFLRAAPRAQLDQARKQYGRSPLLAEFFARGVARVARDARRDDPSLALEAALTLERLPEFPDAPSPLELLDVEDPVALVSGIEDRGTRERALVLLRESRPDWPELFARLVRIESDTRTLAQLYDALQEADGAALNRTVDDVLARPHTAPRLFIWLGRELRRRPELESKGDWGLLRRLLDAQTLESFRTLRTPLRELFDDGGIGEHLAAGLTREQSDQLFALLQRDVGLDENRKDAMRRAVMRRHPELRDMGEEPLYVTAESLERKRAEFEQIARVDIPHNAEEIRKAAAHGDLRENFEYKAARDRHEMLSSRAASLHEELRRARAVDPASIDPSRVRVGTRVVLEPRAGGGARRQLTILGPWDSDPANGVVSYLAPAIQPLLGKQLDETVQFQDGEFVVRAIAVWRDA